MAKLVGGGVIIILGIVVIVLLSGWVVPAPAEKSPIRLWMAGAAALGLVSGFTTGLSTKPGSGKEFVTYIGAGILVPMLGGVAALLERAEEITEGSEYVGEQVVSKTTRTVTSLPEGALHPLAVLGSFFILFSLMALMGIIAGALLRKGDFINLLTA